MTPQDYLTTVKTFLTTQEAHQTPFSITSELHHICGLDWLNFIENVKEPRLNTFLYFKTEQNLYFLNTPTLEILTKSINYHREQAEIIINKHNKEATPRIKHTKNGITTYLRTPRRKPIPHKPKTLTERVANGLFPKLPPPYNYGQQLIYNPLLTPYQLGTKKSVGCPALAFPPEMFKHYLNSLSF